MEEGCLIGGGSGMPPGLDDGGGVRFQVAYAGREVAWDFRLPKSAAADPRLRDRDRLLLLRLAGLAEIESQLQLGGFPADLPATGSGDEAKAAVNEHASANWSQPGITRLYDRDETEYLLSHESDRKACIWRRPEEPRGYRCLATNVPKRFTTLPLCEKCTVPDARLICANLARVATSLIEASGGSAQRFVVSWLCDRGFETDDPNPQRCVPGGRDCWCRRVAARSQAPPLDSSVSEHLVDEIDFFRLAYRERYGESALWPIGKARSIAALFARPTTFSEFQTCVATLVDLIDQLHLPDSAKGERGERLAALQRLMSEDQPDLVVHVELLRDLVAARQMLAHSNTKRQDLTAIMRDLGVDFPTSDWPRAWMQFLGVCHQSIRGLRLGLQVASPEDDE